MTINIVADTHVGKVRNNNEDAFWHGALPEPEGYLLSLVSDGVGGGFASVGRRRPDDG